jgi:hypothetical protein
LENKSKDNKEKKYFFFFFLSPLEKLLELGGRWRWMATGNGSWWLEMAGGGC